MATDRHQAPSYPLRMPEDLKAKLSEAAAAGGRSLHAELLVRLQDSFVESAPKGDASSTLLVATLQYELANTRVTANRLRNRGAGLGAAIRELLRVMSGATSAVGDIEPGLLRIAAAADQAVMDPETVGTSELVDRLHAAWALFEEARNSQNLDALPEQLRNLLAEVDAHADRLRDEKVRQDALQFQRPLPTLTREEFKKIKPIEHEPHLGVEAAVRVWNLVKQTIPPDLDPEAEIRTVLSSLDAVRKPVSAPAIATKKVVGRSKPKA
ncbi:Arc family DNA-binding protein [Variovorax boronicumulans]|uniref:Arc family DNA-binding protein n=1 Tax=Variovorax boronicumulans TaxID=436515 RepID=UPI0027D8BD62|nr:Arc family DNA-binding protein [Variovorax boronicumulans]